ncbi:MAG: hypothetical protein AAFS02_04105 [Pseudomonadota bacterium]
MSERSSGILLALAAVLWVVWGLVHAMAGTLVILGDAQSGFQAIADGVQPEMLTAQYHPAVGAVLNQHAWNLLWGGLVTIIGAVFIWKRNKTAIWVTAMVGGLLDIGYFVFMDLGGYVRFLPGTLMTIVSATAIIASFAVLFSRPAAGPASPNQSG